MNYYLLLLGEILLLAVLFVLFCRCMYLLVRCKRRYVWRDLLYGLAPAHMKKKGTLLLVSFFFLTLAAMVMTEGRRQSASLNISLTYREASVGLNPNGTRYNMSHILSDQVLENAIEFGGFSSVTADELRSGLKLSPASVQNRSQGDDEESEKLVSTQFVLEFNNNRKTKTLEGKEVVYAVAYAYRNWFIDQYAPNYEALDISFDDIADYDYPDLENYFSYAVQTICSFSAAMNEKDAAFQSTETGESFYSINTKAWNLHDTGLENLSSYILANGLSENRSAFTSRLRYEYTNLCNEYHRNIQAYDVRIKAVEKYDNDMATVVYIPTYDTDNTFYMSKTKIGIDHFSADADELSDAASETLALVLDEKYLMNQLQNNGSSSAAFLRAEKMAQAIKDSIRNLAETLKRTAQDYERESSNGYMTLAEPSDSWAMPWAVVAILSVGFLILLYFEKALDRLNERNGSEGRADE